MSVRLAPLLLIVALATAGCGFKDEPLGRLPKFPQEVTDGSGRTVVVDAAPRRVASLDPGLTASVVTVGNGRLLVAVSGDETGPGAFRRLPDVVTGAGRVKLDALAETRPDLVLAPPGTSERRAEELARRLDAKVYVGSPRSLDGMLHDVFEVGLATGVPERARREVRALRDRVDRVEEAVADQPRRRVFVDRGFFYTIAPGGPADGLIEAAGGRNVAQDADAGVPYSRRRLARARPQVYLASAGSGTTLAGLERSPATRRLPAVREERFTIIPARLLSEAGPRMVASLEQLAAAIHPEIALDGR